MPKVREHIKKAAVGYVVNTDQAEGIVEAIVNVFGIIDTQKDIIHPGAYKKSLNERGNQIRVKVLDNHQANSVVNIVAKALDIHEVNRAQLPEEVRSQWPDATGGLYAKMQFMLDDPTSLAVFKRIDFGASNEYSIGLEIVDQDFSVIKTDEGNQRVRNIRQLALFDVSPVIWGANEATATTAVKGVTKFEDLPLAARGRLWEASAADQRVRAWAGAEDAPNDQYAKAFFWNDPEGDDKFSGFKLGFADIIDGTLTAIPRGIFAVAGVLNGARGGVDIPDADQTAVKAAVSKYYDKMAKEFDDDSIVVPWQVEDVEGKDMGSTSGATGGFNEPGDDPSAAERGKREAAVQERLRKALAKKRQSKNDDEAQTLGSWFMGAMLTMTNDCAEDLLSDGCIDLAGYKSVSDALMAALVAFQSALPPELAMMAYPHDDYDDWFSWFSRDVPEAKSDAPVSGKPLTTAKEGRKLSTATKDKLNSIHKSVNGAAADLRQLIDDTDLQDSAFENADDEGEEKRKAEPDTRPLTFDAADMNRRLEALSTVQYQ
jgi:HK97 family phage prohead protease